MTASWWIQIIETCEAWQTNVGNDLAFLPINLNQLTLPGHFVDVTVIDQMLTQTAVRHGGLSFAIELGRNAKPATFHSLGPLMLAAESVAQALEFFAEYQRVLFSHKNVKLTDDSDCLSLSARSYISFDRKSKASLHTQVCFLGSLLTMLRLMTHQRFSPSAVYFDADICDDQAACLALAFGCSVHQGQGELKIVFSRSHCVRKLSTVNYSSIQAYKLNLETEIASFARQDIVQQVIDQILHQLAEGEINQKLVAAGLYMSQRNMQRKLQEADTNYKTLLEQCRKKLALKYLDERRLTLGEISYLLRFSSTANFYRAFKRWTKQSPGSYRQERV